MTPESATSVVLTKVLLPEAEHVPLAFRERGPDDAKLLIGDAALRSAFEDPTPARYDLGRLWLRADGPPVVFAVWAAPGATSAAGMGALKQALVESVRLARTQPERLAHEASARYG